MIITNNVPRDLLDAFELTPAERAEFDYYDWDALGEGRDSATFFRYRGTLYDLANFTCDSAPAGWDAGMADSFFSSIVVRLAEDGIIVGSWYAD